MTTHIGDIDAHKLRTDCTFCGVCNKKGEVIELIYQKAYIISSNGEINGYKDQRVWLCDDCRNRFVYALTHLDEDKNGKG